LDWIGYPAAAYTVLQQGNGRPNYCKQNGFTVRVLDIIEL